MALRVVLNNRGLAAASKRAYSIAVAQDTPIKSVATEPKPFVVGPAETTKLSNGVTVISRDSSAAYGSVSLVVGAGMKNETTANVGISHFLRSVAFQSNKARTAVRVTRESENSGMTLGVQSKTDAIQYSATFLRGDMALGVKSLVENVTEPEFFRWEVDRVKQHIAAETAAFYKTPEHIVYEEALRAAFHNTAGRAFTCPASRINKYTAADVAAFAHDHFVGNKIVVVGNGVSHQELLDAVSGLGNLPASGVATAPAKFFGGAQVRRDDFSSSQVRAFWAFEGAARGDKDAAAAAVLAAVLGRGPAVKWSGSSASRLGAVLKGSGRASGQHFALSDTGAVCVYTEMGADKGDLVGKIADEISSVMQGNISDEDVERAKKTLINNIAEESTTSQEQHIALLALSGKSVTQEERIAQVSAVSKADVTAAAKRAAGSKPVFVATGNLDKVPYF